MRCRRTLGVESAWRGAWPNKSSQRTVSIGPWSKIASAAIEHGRIEATYKSLASISLSIPGDSNGGADLKDDGLEER